MIDTLKPTQRRRVQDASAFVSYAARDVKPDALLLYPPHKRIPHIHMSEMGFDEYLLKYSNLVEMLDLGNYFFGAVNYDSEPDTRTKELIDWEYFIDPARKEDILNYLRGNAGNRKLDNIVRLITALIPKDYSHFVFVLAFPKQTSMMLCLAKRLKFLKPDCTITVVRTMKNSFMAIPPRIKDLIDFPFIDVVANSFENNIADIVSGKEFSEIEDILYKDSGGFKVTAPGTGFVRLPDLPSPKYQHLKGRKAELLYYELARGCVEQCPYCMHGEQTLTYNPVEKIVHDLKYLSETFECKNFQLINTAINFSKKFILSLCDAIVENGIDINWNSYIFLNLIDDETAAAMSRAGCVNIDCGIESPVENELNAMKYDEFADIRKKLEILRRHNIKVNVSFMTGGINYDDKEEQAIIDFLIDHKGLINVVALNMFELHSLNVNNYKNDPSVRISKKFLLDKRYYEFSDDKFDSFSDRQKAVGRMEKRIIKAVEQRTDIKFLHWEYFPYKDYKNNSLEGEYLNLFTE